MPGKNLALRHRSALLDRLLEQPDIVQQVQQLPAASLARAIQHIGLEDAGELVAMASAQQLADVFDEDLWVSHEPGMDERFDAARFGLWLSILLENGGAFAARKLLDLDEDFVVIAISSQILVIDIEQLATQLSSNDRSDDDEQLDKALESALNHEFEQYRVIAREPQHWDAVLTILCELNEQHYGFFSTLLERCCALSSGYIEDHGGLYDVLSELETLVEDVAGAREERREEQGYVAPSAARAFLQLTLQSSEQEILDAQQGDAITKAHFRARSHVKSRGPASRAKQESPRNNAVLALLAELDTDAAQERTLPRLPRADAASGADTVQEAMRSLQQAKPELYERRALELAYVANVLLAGHALDGRRMRPVEALETALAMCDAGVARSRVKRKKERTSTAVLLETTGLITLFQLGYRARHQPLKSASAQRPR